MQHICPGCQSILHLNESEYQPGEIVTIRCPQCATLVNISISQLEPEKARKAEESQENANSKGNSSLTVNHPYSPEEIPSKPTDTQPQQTKKKNRNDRLFATLAVALILITLSILILLQRSSHVSTAEGHYVIGDKLDVLPSIVLNNENNEARSLSFGTPISVLHSEFGWHYITASGGQINGYVDSKYIADSTQFHILTSCLNDRRGINDLPTLASRLALILYFVEECKRNTDTQPNSNHNALTSNSSLTSEDENKDKMEDKDYNMLSPLRLAQHWEVDGPCYFKNKKKTFFSVDIRHRRTNERKRINFLWNDDETALIYTCKEIEKGGQTHKESNTPKKNIKATRSKNQKDNGIKLSNSENKIKQNAHTIKGIVTDAANDKPLPLVHVFVKGTQKEILTDNEGRFTMQTSGAKTTLVFFCSGYDIREIPVNGQSNIHVTLRELIR